MCSTSTVSQVCRELNLITLIDHAQNQTQERQLSSEFINLTYENSYYDLKNIIDSKFMKAVALTLHIKLETETAGREETVPPTNYKNPLHMIDYEWHAKEIPTPRNEQNEASDILEII